MSRYKMSDGTIVETERCSEGRYYIVFSSQWQGTTAHAEWVSLEEACRWLLANEYEVGSKDWPKDLTSLVDDLVE